MAGKKAEEQVQWTEVNLEIIQTFLKNRVPPSRIAKHFGVSKPRIYQVMKHYNLSPILKPRKKEEKD